MVLTEQTVVPTAALPIQEFKDHLRLGTGFVDDGVQDALAEGYLRAALAAIEGRIGKALIARDFLLTLNGWRDSDARNVDCGQCSSVGDSPGQCRCAERDRSQCLSAAQGQPSAPAGWRGDGSAIHPDGRDGGSAVHGRLWPSLGDVPVDLAQAAFLLAAQFPENRHESAERPTALPFGVMALIERWRTVRVLGGGEA